MHRLFLGSTPKYETPRATEIVAGSLQGLDLWKLRPPCRGREVPKRVGAGCASVSSGSTIISTLIVT